jgi:hypothetical protein
MTLTVSKYNVSGIVSVNSKWLPVHKDRLYFSNTLVTVQMFPGYISLSTIQSLCIWIRSYDILLFLYKSCFLKMRLEENRQQASMSWKCSMMSGMMSMNSNCQSIQENYEVPSLHLPESTNRNTCQDRYSWLMWVKVFMKDLKLLSWHLLGSMKRNMSRQLVLASHSWGNHGKC